MTATVKVKVKVKEKFQITIPKIFRKQMNLAVGDTLAFSIKDKTMILKPKNDKVNNAILEGLDDFREGRVAGPFLNIRGLKKFLKQYEEGRFHKKSDR